MKETWKQFKKGAIVVSCCMLALGVLTILWPDISALTVCILLGIFCIAEGVYMIVRYFKLGLAGIFSVLIFSLVFVVFYWVCYCSFIPMALWCFCLWRQDFL